MIEGQPQYQDYDPSLQPFLLLSRSIPSFPLMLSCSSVWSRTPNSIYGFWVLLPLELKERDNGFYSRLTAHEHTYEPFYFSNFHFI